MNAGNHQSTFGVLGAAVCALIDWIEKGAPTKDGVSRGAGAGLGPGAAYFEIWDGRGGGWGWADGVGVGLRGRKKGLGARAGQGGMWMGG